MDFQRLASSLGQCSKLIIAFDPVGRVDIQCLPISNVVATPKRSRSHAGSQQHSHPMIAQGETGDFWFGNGLTLFSGISSSSEFAFLEVVILFGARFQFQ